MAVVSVRTRLASMENWRQAARRGQSRDGRREKHFHFVLIWSIVNPLPLAFGVDFSIGNAAAGAAAGGAAGGAA